MFKSRRLLLLFGTGLALDLSGCGSGNSSKSNDSSQQQQSAPIVNSGIVTTLAGTLQTSGSLDTSPGVDASFNYPKGIAIDSSGNLYVSDNASHCVRKITSAGVVTTFAGQPPSSGSANGHVSVASFNSPHGIAIDPSGNIYIVDNGNHLIRKINSTTGIVSTLAGDDGFPGYIDATGVAARFDSPVGIAIDSSGNLYVTDSNNRLIRKITPAGDVSTLAGQYATPGAANGNNLQAQFETPYGIGIDSSNNLYVTDTGNQNIRKISVSGTVTTIAGIAGFPGAYQDGPGPSAQFNNPTGVAVDRSSNIYIADEYNNLIRKISPAGDVTTLAGNVNAGFPFFADGTGSSANFFNPTGVAVTNTGLLYTTDSSNQLIRKIV